MLDYVVFFSSCFFDTEPFRTLEEGGSRETLQFWECEERMVVVGASGQWNRDLHEEACTADKVPVVQRLSGGGAVIVGRGCLSYSMVLSLEAKPELRSVAHSYTLILGRIVERLGLPSLAVRGMSDITIGDRKISGNAQRRGRRALLHHGTILYDFDVRCMERYLKEPQRQPAYRAGRSHSDFVTNAPLERDAIKDGITRAWNDLKGDLS